MLEQMCKDARQASRLLAKATSEQKDNAMLILAELLWARREEIIAANQVDVALAQKAGISPAVVDRLTLNESRLSGIIADLKNVIQLPDPIGETFDARTLPNGLQIRRQRVPIGVLAVIYEARPNVTIDIAGLALKTGNSIILRGGSETIRSNQALVAQIQEALDRAGLPAHAVSFIDNPDRALVTELLSMHDYIDMLIPRGAEALHRFCRENSHIPVITGGIGICHLYVDKTADQEAALKVIQNAKVQRPSVCNALDTVLVERSIADNFLPKLVDWLKDDGVTFRVEPAALAALGNRFPEVVQPAGPDDFDQEWLSLVLGLKVVSGLDEAMEHIAAHSTQHSDGILTRDEQNAQRFVAEVDSAAVYVNASTRFTDGGQFGLGAEVAVSTQRLHARGPMGLKELTIYKWVVIGDNHVRP